MRTSLDQHHDDGGPRPGDRVEQSRLSFGKPEFSQVHTFPAGHPHGIAGDGDRSTVGVESRPRRPRTRSAEHHHRDIGTGRESDRLGEGRQIPADEIAAPAVRDLRAVRSRGLEAAPHGLLQPGKHPSQRLRSVPASSASAPAATGSPASRTRRSSARPSAITRPVNPHRSRRIPVRSSRSASQGMPSNSLYAAMTPAAPARIPARAASRWISCSSRAPSSVAARLRPPTVAPCPAKCVSTTAARSGPK